MYNSYFLLFLSLILTSFFIIILSRIAKKIEFVDIPNARKIHEGRIPLVGGICIFLSLSTFLIISFEHNYDQIYIIMLSSSLILFVGIMDDLYSLNVFTRIISQVAACLPLVYYNIIIFDLDFIIIPNNLYFFSVIFTIFCVVVLTNAYNFIDGVDGFCALSSIVTLSILSFYFYEIEDNTFNFLIFLIFCILVFLFFNFGFFKNYKIFLGDSGSTFLGFFISWFYIYASQLDLISPVLVLWCLCLPAFDLFRVIILRLTSNQKIYKADRNHFHHILLSYTNNNFIALFIYIFIQIFLFLLGKFSILLFGSFVSLIFFILIFFSFLQFTKKLNY